MNINCDEKYLISLTHELCKSPKETEWIEFKHNNEDPRQLGENISALANSAALLGKVKAFIIWGINDQNHKISGTKFNPLKRKIGNEEL